LRSAAGRRIIGAGEDGTADAGRSARHGASRFAAAAARPAEGARTMKTLSSYEFKSPVAKSSYDWDAILSGEI
jgi:hypothetical protein